MANRSSPPESDQAIHAQASTAVSNSLPPDSQLVRLPENEYQPLVLSITNGNLPKDKLEAEIERFNADWLGATRDRKAAIAAGDEAKRASTSTREQTSRQMSLIFWPQGARQRQTSVERINEINKKKQQEAEVNKADVHRWADHLLSKEKSITRDVKRRLAGRIMIQLNSERESKGLKALTDRTIRTCLKSHPSGLW